MPEKYGINPVWTLLVAAIAVAGTISSAIKCLRRNSVFKQPRPSYRGQMHERRN